MQTTSTLPAVSRRVAPTLLALAGLMLLVGGTLAWLGARRYLGYNAGMLDLGNMYQATASVLRGEPLVVTSVRGNVSRLSGHVELIYLAFVPLVALWRSPMALVVGQALLFAAGAVPAYRLALRRLDSPSAALCVAAIYLLYPVGLTAVIFDFHGDTLALPLLMFALEAADRRAWRGYAAWVALALACKVYIALPVAGLGAYLVLWGGQRRAGLITAAVAVAYGAAAFLGLRELFREAGAAGSAAGSYASFYFGSADGVLRTAGERVLNALVVFGPALLVAWRGWRWLLVGAPIALAALASTAPGAGYDFRYHHYAAVVPFVVMAVVDGAARMRGPAAAGRPATRRSWRGDLIFTAVVVAVIAALLVDTPLNPTFWLRLPGSGLDPSVYGVTSRDRVKDAFLAANVPPAAPVAASMFLATHIADRETLYVVRYSDDPGGRRLPELLPRVDAAVADALFDWRLVSDGELIGGIDYEAAEIATLLRDPGFALRASRDGLLLFDRGGAGLRQEAVAVGAGELPAAPADFGPLRLLGARLTPEGGRRYLAEFEWQLSGGAPAGRLVAVSRLEGVPDARIVHLPSYLLLPTDTWRPGQVIRERFEVELPADLPPGSYAWRTGWYDPARSEAYATDARSRLPGSDEAGVGSVVVAP